MISVAILAFGLVLILQAFIYILNVFCISQNNLKAALLAEEKMAEFQINLKQKDYILLEDLSEDLEIGSIKFKWKLQLTLDKEYQELNKLYAAMSWKEGERKGSFPIVTYLRIPPQDEMPEF